MKRFIALLLFCFSFSAYGRPAVFDFSEEYRDVGVWSNGVSNGDISINRMRTYCGINGLTLNSEFSKDDNLYVGDVTDEQMECVGKYKEITDGLESYEFQVMYSLPDDELSMSAIPVTLDSDGKTLFQPNDPSYKFQWHMDQIGMPEAWNGNNGKGAVVAVIDTGVGYRDWEGRDTRFVQLEDLKNTCFVPGYDFVNDNAFPLDDQGHGSHVTGTIAQSTNNGIGTTGVAPQSCIMPLKVLSKTGQGTDANVAEAIKFAADHGANVINMSLGGPFPSKVVNKAVQYAYKKGVTIVAAAGNDGKKRVGYPAACDNVIAVSATDLNEDLAFYSQYGDQIDIAAPGGDARSDKNKDGVPDGVIQNTIWMDRTTGDSDPSRSSYYPFMGTSMATPHVAGVAALIVASGVTKPDKVAKVLYSTASREAAIRNGAPKNSTWDNKYGHGRLDAAKALKKTKDTNNNLSFLLASAFGLVSLWYVGKKQLVTNRFSALQFVLGIVGASAGLLFLIPQLGIPLGEYSSYLATGLPALDTPLFGANWHGSLLSYSPLIPFLLLGLLAHTRFASVCAGISFGFAGSLIFASYDPSFDMILPGTFLDQAWLLASGLVSALIGYTLLIRNRKELAC